jgi:hypothetical protein
VKLGLVAAYALVLVLALVLVWADAASADSSVVDGISDQGLAAWEGSFPTSSFAAAFGDELAGGQVRYARYVVQWDAMASDAGDYRERFELWLADVRALALTPVVALTSYDGVYPADAGQYERGLDAVLALAADAGWPVRYVEAWNEPNNQGRERAVTAAAFAYAAQHACATRYGCTVIAGDLEDAPGMAAYEAAYVHALAFRPLAWGIHPYRSLARRDTRALREYLAGLPGGTQLWLTEVAAFYCRHGRVLGEGAQASEAAFLVHTLIREVSVAHVFYYGVMSAFGRPVPCGDDSELYGPEGQPRQAAGVVFGPAADGRWPLLGPAPGQQPLAFQWLGE